MPTTHSRAPALRRASVDRPGRTPLRRISGPMTASSAARRGRDPPLQLAAGPGIVGRSLLGDTYATIAEGGELRAEWTWSPSRRVVGPAPPGGASRRTSPLPRLVRLHRRRGRGRTAAGRTLHAEYSLLLPPGWREEPDVRAAAEALMAAVRPPASAAVERYRYTWTADGPLPARTGRLVCRPEPDDSVFRGVVRRVEEGSLDAHDVNEIAETAGTVPSRGPRLLARCLPRGTGGAWPTPRPARWRAPHPHPQPVGPCIGYIGVLPEQRGHGYAYDLLVDCTQDLVERGATRIAAATDQGNFPMAAHFATMGYPVTEERIDFI